MKLSKFFRSELIAASLLIGTYSFAADIDMSADENDVAIRGYDTVAYFTKGKAIEGSHQYTATYKNAIYQFSTEKNRDLFKSNPAQYAPQFGGFCAMGVALEKKLDVDPTAFKIVDNKLYLNLNSAVQKKWLTDISGHIETADDNWVDIRAKSVAELNED